MKEFIRRDEARLISTPDEKRRALKSRFLANLVVMTLALSQHMKAFLHLLASTH